MGESRVRNGCKGGKDAPPQDSGGKNAARVRNGRRASPQDLESRISQQKRTKDPSQVNVVDAELVANDRASNGDVGSIEEGNRAEQENTDVTR